MIKENEIRIGNILNYTTAEGDILPTKLDWQDLKWISEDTAGFNLVHDAIEITEEILLKCGFGRSSSKTELWRGEDPMLIWKTDYESENLENHYEFRFGITQSFKAERQVKVKHLHHLQNLYFVLTGKELEVNI